MHRRHGTKPSLALWLLVAVGDLAIIVANAGTAVLVALLCVLTVGVAAVGATALRRSRAHMPVPVPIRRR